MQYFFLAKIVCSRVDTSGKFTTFIQKIIVFYKRGGDFACHFKNFLISAKKVGALSIGGDLAWNWRQLKEKVRGGVSYKVCESLLFLTPVKKMIFTLKWCPAYGCTVESYCLKSSAFYSLISIFATKKKLKHSASVFVSKTILQNILS